MRFVLPLVYMLGIFALSSLPGDSSNGGSFVGLLPPSLQNALHIPLFAGLAFCWLYALQQISQPLILRATLAALISMLYGAVDEWHQMSVPGRYGSATDLMLDGIGALLVFSVLILPPPLRSLFKP